MNNHQRWLVYVTNKKMFLNSSDSRESTVQRIVCSSSHRKVPQKKILYKDFNLFPGTKKGEWPKKTSISCWYCTEPFECVPKSIPVGYKNNIWNVKGVFCSFECAKSYLVREYPNYEEQIILLNIFASTFFGYTEPIQMSPKVETLSKFGGGLSIDEFRSKCRLDTTLVEPPYKPCKATINISTNQPLPQNEFRFGQTMGLKKIQSRTDEENESIRNKHRSNKKIKFFYFLQKKI